MAGAPDGAGGVAMPVCGTDLPAGLVAGLIGTVDCYITEFAQGSYRDLVGPGTYFAAVFTALLTIYVALMGYQLLLGRAGLRATDLPLTAMKVGLILAFLTSWAAYQTIVYNLLFNGPQEIARVLLSQLDRLNGNSGTDVFTGLEKTFYSLIDSAAVYGRQAGGNVNILQGGPALGAGMLWFSAVVMLLASVGLILASKILLGLLLAVGPLFIALFLFDATRGIFDGWLRTTIGFAIVPLATTVFSAAMLMMLSPFVARLAALARANRFDMGVVVTITIVVAVFVIVVSQAIRLGMGIAAGYRTGVRGKFHPQNSATAISPAGARPAHEREASGPAVNQHASVTYRSRIGDGESADSSRIYQTSSVTRIREMADAVIAASDSSQRLGDAYRRVPLPARRTAATV